MLITDNISLIRERHTKPSTWRARATWIEVKNVREGPNTLENNQLHNLHEYRCNIFKILFRQIRGNFDQKWWWALLPPLHFITGSLNLDNQNLHISYQTGLKITSYHFKCLTFFTRSFSCFLPCS